jgi:hypothetical protein
MRWPSDWGGCRLPGDIPPSWRILGWPFDRLGPIRNKWSVSWTLVGAMAVLAAWWCFVVIRCSSQEGKLLVVMMAMGLGMQLAVARLLTYIMGYSPPINLVGRLLTFRWIIPGYDVVFVTPLFLLIVVGLTGSALFRFKLMPEIVGPALLAAEILIVFFPPSLDEWRLKGEHRIVPAAWNQTNELQQTQ